MSSYDGLNNLNQLSVATPLDGASPAELLLAIREIKTVLKNVLLQSLKPNGTLRGVRTDSLNAASVGSAQLVDLAVITAKIALLAVTEAQLADGAVTTDKLADGAVTGAKLADGSIPAGAYGAASIPLAALAQALTAQYIGSSSSDNSLRAIGPNHIQDSAVLDRAIATMALTKLSGGSAGQILVRGTSGWEAVTLAGGLVYNPTTGIFSIISPATTAYFGDLKSRGVSGGSSLANTWITRDLGEIEDGQNLMTFYGGGTFTLVAGSYFFYARCPVAGAVGAHQARLFRDNGDSTNEIMLWGSSEVCAAGQSGASVVQGTITVTAPSKVFKLEHWTELAVATSGLGLAASSDNTTAYGNHKEAYTTGHLIKYA